MVPPINKCCCQTYYFIKYQISAIRIACLVFLAGIKGTMKELIIIFSSTWKFAATFPVAVYLFNMSFIETILYTNIGGLLGIVLFTLASKGVIKLFDVFDVFLPKVLRKKTNSKKYLQSGTRLINFKNKYGLPGIVILTHVQLSIPIGVFLNTKYYGKRNLSYLFILIGQIVWSFIFTFFYMEVKISI